AHPGGDGAVPGWTTDSPRHADVGQSWGVRPAAPDPDCAVLHEFPGRHARARSRAAAVRLPPLREICRPRHLRSGARAADLPWSFPDGTARRLGVLGTEPGAVVGGGAADVQIASPVRCWLRPLHGIQRAGGAHLVRPHARRARAARIVLFRRYGL